MSDPYMILGISRNASDDEVKKAYRALCRKYHHDANINKPNAEEAAAKFTEVQQAYDQIMEERKLYFAISPCDLPPAAVQMLRRTLISSSSAQRRTADQNPAGRRFQKRD